MKKAGVILIILLSFNLLSLAQEPIRPCDDPDDVGCIEDSNVPLDDWVYVLLIAGVLYGVKKLNKKKVVPK